MHLHKFYALHKKLTRVMLPVVFEEFEVPFFFTQSLSIGKRSSPPPPQPNPIYGPVLELEKTAS